MTKAERKARKAALRAQQEARLDPLDREAEGEAQAIRRAQVFVPARSRTKRQQRIYQQQMLGIQRQENRTQGRYLV